MKKTILKDLAKIRQQLEKERGALLTRLAEIDAALESFGQSPRRIPRSKVRQPPARRPQSLRPLILDVIGEESLAPKAILAAVEREGYVFTSPDPLESLKSVLIKSPEFKKAGGGKFAKA